MPQNAAKSATRNAVFEKISKKLRLVFRQLENRKKKIRNAVSSVLPPNLFDFQAFRKMLNKNTAKNAT